MNITFHHAEICPKSSAVPVRCSTLLGVRARYSTKTILSAWWFNLFPALQLFSDYSTDYYNKDKRLLLKTQEFKWFVVRSFFAFFLFILLRTMICPSYWKLEIPAWKLAMTVEKEFFKRGEALVVSMTRGLKNIILVNLNARVSSTIFWFQRAYIYRFLENLFSR